MIYMIYIYEAENCDLQLLDFEKTYCTFTGIFDKYPKFWIIFYECDFISFHQASNLTVPCYKSTAVTVMFAAEGSLLIAIRRHSKK